MAHHITSATALSSTSSFGCIDNFPKPPSSVHTRPLKSSFIHSMNNLLPPLNTYPPMPCSEIDLSKVHPNWPSLPPLMSSKSTILFGRRNFEDGSRDTIHRNHSMRPDTRLHLITSRRHIITRNPSHRTTSLIRRHIMSWRDAQGLEEQHGCCWRKSFYCSKFVLPNDDDNDEEETFGEYVKSTKQLKKIRSWVEMLKRKDSMDMTTETFSPWFWWIFHDSFLCDSTDILSWLTHLIQV